MKQKLMIAAAACLFALNVHASLIEYDITGKETDTGNGTSDTYSYKGLMIYDTISSNLTFIDWMTGKTYRTYTITNFQFSMVSGPSAQQNVIISDTSSETDTNGYYHQQNDVLAGTDITLHIGRNLNIRFPRSFASPGNSSMGPDGGGNEWFDTWNETFNYDNNRTVSDNNGNLTSVQVANAVIISLQEQGYKDN